MKRSGIRWTRRAACAALAVGVLTGCSGVNPHTVAVVDGSRISTQDVKDLAEARCAALDHAQGKTDPVSRSQVNTQTVSFLLDTALNVQYGKSLHLTPRREIVDALMQQPEQIARLVPAGYRKVLLDDFHTWAEGRDLLIQAGEKASGQPFSPQNANNLALAGLAARKKWEKHVTVSIDPRYGVDSKGEPTNDNGSVSEAASTFAKTSAKSNQSRSFVESLPASQRCG